MDALKTIIGLNDDLMAKYTPEEIQDYLHLYRYETDGIQEAITFDGLLVWCSERDGYPVEHQTIQYHKDLIKGMLMMILSHIK